MKPDFVIIGAQKAGSSALMRHLADHPQLFLPRDETRYFRDPWFQFEDPSVLEDAVATTKPGVRRRGIKCPDLLALPTAPQRVRDELGPVPLIAVLREPVSRAISAYYWYMQWGWLPIAPPEEGLRLLLDGTYEREFPRSAEILDYGRYGTHLERWLQVFPREDLHMLLTDDLRTDPRSTAAELFGFLGVDRDVTIATAGKQVNEGVYSERRLRLLRHRHPHIMRSYAGHPGTYVQKPATARGWLVDRSIAALDRLVLARVLDNSKAPISAEVHTLLGEYYRTEIAKLAKILDRDLSAWSRPAR